MCRGREHLPIRDGADVMLHRRMHIVQTANGPLDRGSRAAADGRRTFRGTAPALFQFVKRGIKFTPLTPREKPPLQRVLQPAVIFTIAPPCQFSARPTD